MMWVQIPTCEGATLRAERSRPRTFPDMLVDTLTVTQQHGADAD